VSVPDLCPCRARATTSAANEVRRGPGFSSIGPTTGRRHRLSALLLLGMVLLAAACAGKRDAKSAKSVSNYTEVGIASWYGKPFHGRRTANGEVYDMHKLTAAHRTLPFGVKVRVTNLENNRRIVVRINDRGPFKRGRIIDLSKAAAKQLNMIDDGVVKVRIAVVR
jgi:rare lipoprotein A